MTPFSLAGVVGVDDGYSETKICTAMTRTSAPGVTSEPNFSTHPSVIERGTSVGTLDGSLHSTWEVDGTLYSVVPMGIGEKLTGTYHTSPENRVLVHHALAINGYSGKDIDILVVGLPMDQFFDAETGSMSEMVQKKIDNLMTPPTPVGQTLAPPRSIKKIDVRPQGLLSFFDYHVNWDGTMARDPEARTAVIDIGGRTTDLALVLNGREIDRKNSTSITLGVLDVYHEFNRLARHHFSLSADLPDEKVKNAMRTGKITIRGVETDVREMVDSESQKVAEQLWRRIQAEMTGLEVADRVILVGGGANLFGKYMQSYLPNAVVPDRPELANVRGMWKVGAISVRS